MPGWGEPAFLLSRHFLDAGRGPCANSRWPHARLGSLSRSAPAWRQRRRRQRGQTRRHGVRQARRLPPERPDPQERNHLARIRRLPRRDRAGAAETLPEDTVQSGFGPTGVCILAKRVDPKTGAVFTPVRNDTVTGLLVTGFPGNGVFGYGTVGLPVTRVAAVNDGGYGISRFVSSRTLFADDTAIGNDEAGFYVGDSPHADTVVRNDRAFGNQFGIFIRHARHVLVKRQRRQRKLPGHPGPRRRAARRRGQRRHPATTASSTTTSSARRARTRRSTTRAAASCCSARRTRW